MILILRGICDHLKRKVVSEVENYNLIKVCKEHFCKNLK